MLLLIILACRVGVGGRCHGGVAVIGGPARAAACAVGCCWCCSTARARTFCRAGVGMDGVRADLGHHLQDGPAWRRWACSMAAVAADRWRRHGWWDGRGRASAFRRHLWRPGGRRGAACPPFARPRRRRAHLPTCHGLRAAAPLRLPSSPAVVRAVHDLMSSHPGDLPAALIYCAWVFMPACHLLRLAVPADLPVAACPPTSSRRFLLPTTVPLFVFCRDITFAVLALLGWKNGDGIPRWKWCHPAAGW